MTAPTTSTDDATAAVWRGPGGGFAIERIPLPGSLADGEVLVRVRLATLCGSDLHTVAGERETPLPTVLGHEMVGDVLGTAGTVRTGVGPVRCRIRDHAGPLHRLRGGPRRRGPGYLFRE